MHKYLEGDIDWDFLEHKTMDEMDQIVKEIPPEFAGYEGTLPWIINVLKERLDDERKRSCFAGDTRICSSSKVKKAVLDGLRHSHIDHPGSIDPNMYDSIRKRIMANIKAVLTNHNIKLK